jgi:hypothetical protein
MAGFQKQVNIYSAPAAIGAVASNNPWIGYVAGPNAVVSGANGVAVGRFAWATPMVANGPIETAERADSNALLVADGVNRAPSGFVHNEQQGGFTGYLQESGLSILPWQAMDLATRGDFWAQITLNPAVRDQKIYANMLDGSITSAATGATIAAKSYTASFATSVMTVTVAPGTPLAVGDAVVGAGIPANTYIKSFGTGSGGTGTYNLTTAPGTIAAQATTSTSWIETKFRVLSAALANEFVKIGFGD